MLYTLSGLCYLWNSSPWLMKDLISKLPKCSTTVYYRCSRSGLDTCLWLYKMTYMYVCIQWYHTFTLSQWLCIVGDLVACLVCGCKFLKGSYTIKRIWIMRWCVWLWDFMYNEKEEIVSSITPNLNSIHWTRALCGPSSAVIQNWWSATH